MQRCSNNPSSDWLDYGGFLFLSCPEPGRGLGAANSREASLPCDELRFFTSEHESCCGYSASEHLRSSIPAQFTIRSDFGGRVEDKVLGE